ncbi:cation:proton antiporter [Ramlibacter solisilvae]|uniref:Sodium:proton antiporter n=1 Tax=Ramlibacter tataouinensis TaxID=94132 RepID=A0A127JWT5_9BURK|nr:cation:proton antiporter [Ramlibacter tataouinensis]AMO24466.1 sodium:proton antiporter [Ramlibacter tataouinensis]
MDVAIWALLAGALLIFMALGGSVLARLPLSTAMIYLGFGMLAGPWVFDLMRVDLREHTHALERMAEAAVLVSLFTAGLKLGPAFRDRRWVLPLRLAVVAMVATVLVIAALAHFFLGLPWGAGILLGGILAPTDPVLASDVQVMHPKDRDSLRFALTGEGGLNDGTAFPFVLLGLGLMGLHDLGPSGWRWLLVDGVWACLAGPVVGAFAGLAVGRLVLYLRRVHKEAVGLDDFLAMGLLALTYGIATIAHVNSFLAVFAAGIALRYLEQSESAGSDSQQAVQRAAAQSDGSLAQAVAVDPLHAPAYMAHAVMSFNEQLERVGEMAVVVAIGALLWSVHWQGAGWWFVPALLLLVRPLVVSLSLRRTHVSRTQRGLIGWFGIRGVGSLFYLMYAMNHGLSGSLADQIAGLTLAVVVASILVHGISVTPLMAAYERRRTRGARTSRKR